MGAFDSKAPMLCNRWSKTVRVEEAAVSRATQELSEAELAKLAAELRAKAARYRLLAESLFDSGMVAVVLNCARELEGEAAALETAR
jgi:hypothetical protein